MEGLKKEIDNFFLPYEGKYFNQGLSLVLDKKHRDEWEKEFSELVGIDCIPIMLWWRGVVFAVAYDGKGLTFLINQGQYGISRKRYDKWFKQVTKDNTFDTPDSVSDYLSWINNGNIFTQDNISANNLEDLYFAMPSSEFFPENPRSFFRRIWIPAFERGSFKDLIYPDSFV